MISAVIFAALLDSAFEIVFKRAIASTGGSGRTRSYAAVREIGRRLRLGYRGKWPMDTLPLYCCQGRNARSEVLANTKVGK